MLSSSMDHIAYLLLNGVNINMSIPKENISQNEANIMGDLDEGLKEIAKRKFKPEDNPYYGTTDDPFEEDAEEDKKEPKKEVE